MQHTSISSLYIQNQHLHQQRVQALLARIHAKLASPPQKCLLSSINFQNTARIISQFRQSREDRTQWQKVAQQEQKDIQASVKNDLANQISENESQILFLQSEVKKLQQSQTSLINDRSILSQRLLQLQKQRVLIASQSSNIAPEQRHQIAMGFAFHKDDDGNAKMNEDYTKIIDHLLNRVKSNQKKMEYLEKKCEKRFINIENKKYQRQQYEDNLKEIQFLEKELQRTDSNINEYQKKMSEKVKNFQEKVNKRLGEEMGKVVAQKRPEKQRHQVVFSELNDIIKKLASSAEIGHVNRSFMSN